MFQFPSNGKAYLNIPTVDDFDLGTVDVSIPFKRESISEPILEAKGRLEIIEFQFPSNGKAYLNLLRDSEPPLGVKRFNSLQTGKHI